MYAMVLNYPYANQGVSLFSLAELGGNIDKVTMLGFPSSLGVRPYIYVDEKINLINFSFVVDQ